MNFRQQKSLTLDPRTKLALILLANVLMYTYGNSVYLHIATAFALLLTVVLGRWKGAMKMSAFCAVLYALTYVMGFAPKEISNLWGVFVLPIILFIPLFTFANLLFCTTEISELITAFQKMKFPSAILTPLIVMYRFFPTLKIELIAIRDAMKLKGIRKNPIKLLEYVYAPILFNCVRISDELNVSGLTRGLGLHKTSTQTVKLRFTLLDVVSILVLIALIVLRGGWVTLW